MDNKTITGDFYAALTEGGLNVIDEQGRIVEHWGLMDTGQLPDQLL